ncbi:hypothetical protein [Paenibacillus faecalis]|uniref:hypothetical protein n=1 Tax=Paenibacillus faecalis TaxID=2079532 RepID=UPI000D0E3A10|nr:hypothetical protein [Paenibacillus faecalis]
MINYKLKVSNLKKSINFYKELGFNIEEVEISQVIARFLDCSLFLYTGEFQSRDDNFVIETLSYKTRIYINCNEDLFNEIVNKENFLKYTKESLSFEWKSVFEVVDLDGYILQFICVRQLEDQRILDLYHDSIKIVNELKKTIVDWDYMQNNGWTIKQELFHLIEEDLCSLASLRMNITSPGQIFNTNVFDHDQRLGNLPINELSITYVLDIFINIRLHMLEILNNGDYMNNYIIVSNKKVYLRNQLQSLATHSLEHLENIRNFI